MKKLFYIISMPLIMAMLFACEAENETYDGEEFISFRKTTEEISYNESDGEVSLTIASTRKVDSDVTIQLNIEEVSATANEDFSLPTSITIPAGSQSVELPITIIDDDVINSLRQFKITIESVSDNSYSIGIKDIGSYQKTIKIINDDCPTQFAKWIGDVTVYDSDSDSTTNASASSNASGDCDILILNDNILRFNGATETFTIEFTAAPGTEGKFGDVFVPETLVLEEADADGLYDLVYTGSGTFNAETGVIEIQYQALAKERSTGEIAGTFWTGTTIITKE